MPRAYKRSERPGPIPFSAMTFNGVGGPAGSAKCEPITGVECDFCHEQMTSGHVEGGMRSCLRRKCRRKHSDALRFPKEAVA